MTESEMYYRVERSLNRFAFRLPLNCRGVDKYRDDKQAGLALSLPKNGPSGFAVLISSGYRATINSTRGLHGRSTERNTGGRGSVEVWRRMHLHDPDFHHRLLVTRLREVLNLRVVLPRLFLTQASLSNSVRLRQATHTLAPDTDALSPAQFRDLIGA